MSKLRALVCLNVCSVTVIALCCLGTVSSAGCVAVRGISREGVIEHGICIGLGMCLITTLALCGFGTVSSTGCVIVRNVISEGMSYLTVSKLTAGTLVPVAVCIILKLGIGVVDVTGRSRYNVFTYGTYLSLIFAGSGNVGSMNSLISIDTTAVCAYVPVAVSILCPLGAVTMALCGNGLLSNYDLTTYGALLTLGKTGLGTGRSNCGKSFLSVGKLVNRLCYSADLSATIGTVNHFVIRTCILTGSIYNIFLNRSVLVSVSASLCLKEENLVKIGMSIKNSKNYLVVASLKRYLAKAYSLPIPIGLVARAGKKAGGNSNCLAVNSKTKLGGYVVSARIGSAHEEHLKSHSLFNYKVELKPSSGGKTANACCAITNLRHILTCRNSACIDHILSGNNALVIKGLCLYAGEGLLLLNVSIGNNVEDEAVNVGVGLKGNGKSVLARLKLNSVAKGDIFPVPIHTGSIISRGKIACRSKLSITETNTHILGSCAAVCVGKSTVNLNSCLFLKNKGDGGITAAASAKRLSTTCGRSSLAYVFDLNTALVYPVGSRSKVGLVEVLTLKLVLALAVDNKLVIFFNRRLFRLLHILKICTALIE